MPPWPPQPPSPPPPPPRPPPLYCPRLPPYPGVSRVQIIDCDIENPQPDVCGLRPFNGASIRLTPGQALAVRYTNLASSSAPLSRLVLSGERLAFDMDPAYHAGSGVGSGAPFPPRLLLASGLCPDLASLSACLEAAYHGIPAYRACGRCLGVGLVSELGDPRDGGGAAADGNPGSEAADGAGAAGWAPGWSGDASRPGDTSYFASQLPAGTDSLMFFLASMSSAPVRLSYARAARLLYAPGAQVAFLPPRNASFEGVVAPAAAGGGSGEAATAAGGGGGGSLAASPTAAEQVRAAGGEADGGGGVDVSAGADRIPPDGLARAVVAPGGDGGQPISGAAWRLRPAGRWLLFVLLLLQPGYVIMMAGILSDAFYRPSSGGRDRVGEDGGRAVGGRWGANRGVVHPGGTAASGAGYPAARGAGSGTSAVAARWRLVR